MKKIIFQIIFFAAVFFAFFSCKKENYVEFSDAKPGFSVDTLTFDTVFQSIGSATRHFMVYNPYDAPLRINTIRLARGSESPFRINFNGISNTDIYDITIPSKDSVYVFAEVTVNPAENALLEKDSVVFETAGTISDVKLIAYGQDIHLINDSVVDTQTWTAQKPYLITNSMAVAENAVLTIEAGAQLHFSRNSRLYVLGTLIAEGTPDEPIVFQGDRLEQMYADVPGQWIGLWFTKLSKDNYLNYTEIKNAHIGIQADSVQNQNPMLRIYNSKVQHHSLFGIYAQMSVIEAANLLVANCGRNALALTRGGAYRFYHSTIANYWRAGIRTTPSVLLNNYFVHDGVGYLYDMHEAYFGNCIINGNRENEVFADFYTEGTITNYTFENCMLDIGDDTEFELDNSEHFIGNIINADVKFVDIQEYNYELDARSPAINSGSFDIMNYLPEILMFDILNTPRPQGAAPDIGAYEYINR